MSPTDLPVRSEPAETASATQASTPTPTATPAPPSGGIGGDITVPGVARVTADQLLIRREPGLTAEPVMTAEACIDNPDPNCRKPFMLGTERGYVELYVFDGPRQADGYDWYLAATEMLTEERSSAYPEAVGWVAAGDEADAWIVAAPRDCPSQPVELADVTNLSMTRLERLHCVGRQALTFRGWYPELPPGEEEPTAYLEDCREELGWLPCESIFDILRPETGSWAGDADYLDFVIDPAAGVRMPARNQWVEVTGSFDHPAASTCGDVGAVLICRFTFVVTSAVVP
jgi:hypothetical protein